MKIDDLLQRLVMGGVFVALLVLIVRLANVGPKAEHVSTMPLQVWEGGTTVQISLFATEPGHLQVVFERDVDTDDDRYARLEVDQDLNGGNHRFRVSVPPKVKGSMTFATKFATDNSYLELGLSADFVEARTQRTPPKPVAGTVPLEVQLLVADYATGSAR